MVSMAWTNQRRLRKGWKTPHASDSEWKTFPARLKEGRKSVPALFQAGRERIRNTFSPAFFFRDGSTVSSG